MIKAKWLIDKYIIQNTSYEDLPNIIENLGYEVKLIEYNHSFHKTDYDFHFNENDCVIPYTSLQLARKLPFFIGQYFTENKFLYSSYVSNTSLSNHLYLNSDGIFTTFRNLKENKYKFVKLFNTETFFIRPNSGAKLFTGTILDTNSWSSELNAIEQLTGVVDDSLILISPKKEIEIESRFIIADGKVITGSTYMLKGFLYESINVDQSMVELAEIVAKDDNPPALVYTCDIAKLQNGDVKLIELNSFNCAGWYASDIEKIIINVSQLTEKIYEQDYF